MNHNECVNGLFCCQDDEFPVLKKVIWCYIFFTFTCAMAGTNVMGFRSRSSHNTSPNCSGVISVSAAQTIFKKS